MTISIDRLKAIVSDPLGSLKWSIYADTGEDIFLLMICPTKNDTVYSWLSTSRPSGDSYSCVGLDRILKNEWLPANTEFFAVTSRYDILSSIRKVLKND